MILVIYIGGCHMIKKFSFSFSLLLFSLFFFSSSSTLANGENIETEVIELELNLEDLNYVEVSEEQVILDYMRNKNVDREQAIKELSINKLKNNAVTTMNNSCTTSWRYYDSPKVKIDSLSSSYLTVHPYVQVKNCSGYYSFVSVSSTVNHTLDDPLNVIRFDGGIQAQLDTSNRIQVSAKGHVKNAFGIKLRSWDFSATIYAMNEINPASH